mgnify:CR=1 FL=1
MKTKEEVIKEDWVLFGVDSNESYDGWISAEYIPEEAILSGMLDLKNFRTSTDYDEPFYRPKSLQGIESNNGWISINSEKDLPSESCSCWIQVNGFATNTPFWFNYGTTQFSFNDIIYNFSNITHYQPIVKPNPALHK